MVKQRFYPPADHKKQWFGSGSYAMPKVDKLVLHTTETAGGWPGYQGGAITPTLTYEPWRHAWRQHLPINGSARALRDPSATAVKENRDNVVQVEISCYCDPKHKTGGRFVAGLDQQALHDLGDFAAWLHTEWGLPLRLAPRWLPYPSSYGSSAARMTGAEYADFRGILGHQHVSGNDHGDPGALDVRAILARAKRTAGAGAPADDAAHTNGDVHAGGAGTDWSLDRWNSGDPDTVVATEAELLRRGFLRDGVWAHDRKTGSETTAAIRRFQRSIGANPEFADGLFGPRQWDRFWRDSA